MRLPSAASWAAWTRAARVLGAVLAAALAAGVPAGCARFTRPMYDTIYHGQLPSEVHEKLGKPDRTLDGAWIYVGRNPTRSAAILFENGRVWGKIWSYDKPMDRQMIEEYRRKQTQKR